VASSAGCDAWGAPQPVAGRLDMSVNGDIVETWLVTEDGERLVVIWPRGFSARPATGELLDDTEITIFRSGELVTLDQVSRRDAAGTLLDPIVASGIFDGACWLPEPDS
jgi:hypothetical protein